MSHFAGVDFTFVFVCIAIEVTSSKLKLSVVRFVLRVHPPTLPRVCNIRMENQSIASKGYKEALNLSYLSGCDGKKILYTSLNKLKMYLTSGMFHLHSVTVTCGLTQNSNCRPTHWFSVWKGEKKNKKMCSTNSLLTIIEIVNCAINRMPTTFK